MNKYHLILSKILERGKTQANKKGGIKYLLDQKLSLTAADLLTVFEDHKIARNKLRAELNLFTEGVEDVAAYQAAGIGWWDYCDSLANSYPTYFAKLPALIAQINAEKRPSKNYVLFLGANDVNTDQQPCLSLIQFQISGGKLNLTAYQRSSDASLGLPADLYHLYLISRKVNLPLGRITLFLGNVHIYDNNIAPTRELLAGQSPTFSLNVG
jgi:thymidylate synthase